jgi:hypothetical protein
MLCAGGRKSPVSHLATEEPDERIVHVRVRGGSGEQSPLLPGNRPSLRPGGKAHSVFDGACCILNL